MREEKRSLQTEDPAIAKKRHEEALSDVETRFRTTGAAAAERKSEGLTFCQRLAPTLERGVFR